MGMDVGLVKLPVVKCTLLLAVGAMGCILMGHYWFKQLSPSFICSSQTLVWHSIHVGAQSQPSPFPPYLSDFLQLDQFTPTSSWTHFAASQCLAWHKGLGGRVLGLGTSCAVRHLTSMNLDMPFFRELLAVPSPGRRLLGGVTGLQWVG